MIYDFKCSNVQCDYIVDMIMKLSEYESGKYKKTCPKCKSKLQRSISVPFFQLGGKDWYRDGYSSQNRAEEKQAVQEADNLEGNWNKKMEREQQYVTKGY